jgi:hypothetical protein
MKQRKLKLHLPHLSICMYANIKWITFVGDVEQLAPFEVTQSHPSPCNVFHYIQAKSFLNTTYRLPQRSDFISTTIYNGKLIADKQRKRTSCIRQCIWVEKYQRKIHGIWIWIIQIIIILSFNVILVEWKEIKINKLITDSMHKDFVITGYTMQRDKIINAIKSELPTKKRSGWAIRIQNTDRR